MAEHILGKKIKILIKISLEEKKKINSTGLNVGDGNFSYT